MNIDSRMQLNLSQRLVMTPMLQQAIKLLQMSRLELVELIKQEVLENPVLEEIEEFSEQDADRDEEYSQETESSRLNTALPENLSETDREVARGESLTKQQDSSINWEEYFHDNPTGLGYYEQHEPDETRLVYENILSKTESLTDHLIWQLQMSQIPEREMRIGTFLIGQIDENGYIHSDDVPFGEGEVFEVYKADLKGKLLKAYRTHILKALCQKINAALEREYLSSKIDIAGLEGILANVLVQEYYEDVAEANYAELANRLSQFTLEGIGVIVKFMSELSPAFFGTLSDIPVTEIIQGVRQIQNVYQKLRPILEEHFSVLVKEKYAEKLEKIGLSPEELYLVEYFLSQLSAEEIAYIAGHENAANALKYEKEAHAFLENLRQSYTHIESLQSRKYFLIQLYHVGTKLLLEKFQSACPVRFQKLFLKLIKISVETVTKVANRVSSLTEKLYESEKRISLKEVENVFHHIQTFDPPGVGARDIKECLTLQARNLGLKGTAVDLIIDNYLYELKKGQYETIAYNLNISIEDVTLAAKIISNMSPKPGADFAHERTEYVIPDVYVYKVDEEYEVVLNEDELPPLRINPLYRKFMTGNNHNIPNSTKQYVDQKLRSALWFLRSVEQRKRTLYRVSKSIVKFQREFFERGVSYLKPLVLRDVADDIAMHESTVSRVTTNKYIHTPQGVFELKYFFHSGLETTSGSDVSSLAVKERIKQLIMEEDRSHPRSDKTLETILNQEGIAIARRTIAKYREELNIPSSLQRKVM